MAAEGQSVRVMSDKEVYVKQRCVTEFFHMEKKKEKLHHLHLLVLAEPNRGCEHSEAVSGVFQQWQQQITCTSANLYKHSLQALCRWFFITG